MSLFSCRKRSTESRVTTSVVFGFWCVCLWLGRFCFFLLCAACVPRRSQGRALSVSGMSEKTDFLTFQLFCKNIQQIKQRCNKTNLTPRSSWSETENLRAQSIDGAVPVHSTIIMGVRDTTDGECIGTGTQRNRRSDSKRVVEP